MKNNKLFSWKNYFFYLKHESVINSKVISLAIDNFCKVHLNKLSDDQHMLILFRVCGTDNIFRTLGTLKIISKQDKEIYKTYIIDIFDSQYNNYSELLINQIIFSYGIRDGIAPINKSLNNSVCVNKNINDSITQNYRHYKLPISLDPLNYGNLVRMINHNNISYYTMHLTNGNVFNIDQVTNDNGFTTNKVELFRNNLILKYEDEQISDTQFKRIINNKVYIFNLDGTQELFYVEKPTKFIQSIKAHDKQDSNFLTLDIETKLIDNPQGWYNHEPYLISYYDGVSAYSFYLSDYKSPQDMITKCLETIINNKKYNGCKIYIHNLANFDAIFLFNSLVNLGTVTPIMNDGKLISIKFKNGNFNIQFLDSYQLLLRPLRDLAISFACDVLKGIFPHDFINEYSITYKDTLPQYKYYKKYLSLEDYYEFYNNFYKNNDYWDLKKEAIKYCEADCISLYQVMIKFSNIIFEKYSLNITKYPTISSLTFAIFRCKFMQQDQIPMISGQTYLDIKHSYTGGATDMFIPSNVNNELDINDSLYCYDVNSLYPYVMLNNKLPCGQITYFEGDITKYKPDACGFFYCKVIAPANLNHPIIQLHHNKSTISPLGTFEMMIYSDEIINAQKYGYSFEIMRGYFFSRKENIFAQYIQELYQLRLTYDKQHPMNFIAKILMNSLYGRFGMDDNFGKTTIMNNKEFSEYMQNLNPVNLELINLISNIGDNNKIICSKSDYSNTLLNSFYETHNVNIAIASSITALARIHMSNYKNNPAIKLYYTDTDSIFIDKNPQELNALFSSDQIGNNIGQLKLEYKINKAVFLGPKAYYLELDNNCIIKIRGLNNDIVNSSDLTFDSFNKLLYKDSTLNMKQEKWRKNLTEGSIKVLEHSYEIKQNANKRQLVYSDNNKLLKTIPYIFPLTPIKKPY